MAISTAEDIVKAALRKLGFSSPSDTKKNQALDALNMLLTSWSVGGLLIPYVTEDTHTLTIGTAKYSIGSSGDINTARPIDIFDAFLRDSNSYDRYLQVLSVKEYDQIVSKGSDGKPTTLYYYPSYPLAYIYFDYEPDDTYTLYLKSWKHLTEFSTLGTSIDLPPEYKRALVFNLAVEIASDEDYQLPQEVFMIAQAARENIEHQNAKFLVPPEASFDDAIIQEGGVYNIFTDE